MPASQSHAPFADRLSGDNGTGCQARVAGTADQFLTPPADLLAAMLVAQGWQEDERYRVANTPAEGRAFRQVALATAAGLPLPVIAKAVAMSENLVKQYQELYQQAVADGQMSARLDDLLASPKGGR